MFLVFYSEIMTVESILFT